MFGYPLSSVRLVLLLQVEKIVDNLFSSSCMFRGHSVLLQWVDGWLCGWVSGWVAGEIEKLKFKLKMSLAITDYKFSELSK